MNMARSLLLLVSIVTALVVAFAPQAVQAEEEQECAPDVICIEVTDVFGTVRGPGAFYVINRSRLSLESQGPREDFTQTVVESVRLEPF